MRQSSFADEAKNKYALRDDGKQTHLNHIVYSSSNLIKASTQARQRMDGRTDRQMA